MRIPSLDGGGKLPEKFVPPRLSEAALSAKFVGGVVDGAALDARLAALPAWAPGEPLRIVTVKPGNYTRSGAINVPSGVVLNLYGCKFSLAAGANSDVILVNGATSVFINGGHLDGNAANQANTGIYPGQSGVTIKNSMYVTVRDLFSENTFRHGIDVTTSSYAEFTADECGYVLVENCRVRAFGDDGFTTHFSHHVTFRNCIGYDSGIGGLVTASHGFEIDDGSIDILVDGCIAYGNEGSGFYVKSHTSGPYHSRFTLIGCHAFGNALQGFNLINENNSEVRVSDVSVIGCKSSGNSVDGLRITNLPNVTITDYFADGNRHGIRIVGNAGTDGKPLLTNVIVNGFRIKNTTHSGIMMAEGNVVDGVRFANGLITDQQSENGIYIGVSGVTVDSVRIVAPVLSGIRLRTESSKVRLINVEVRDAPTVGISIEGAASDLIIRNCNLHTPAPANTRPAIEITATATGSKIRVEGNRATGWARGLYVLTGANISDLTVRNNDFTGSTTNGASKTGTVTGYVFEGNLGYATQADGTGTIPDGSASVTVTHGLGSVVKVAPTTVILGKRTAEDVWVSARSTTTFTVTRAGTTGALTFDWRATYLP